MRRETLAAHTLCLEHGADFLARVFRVPFVYDVAERSKIVVLAFAVYTVIDGDKPYIKFRKADFGIHAHLKVVAPETGHILDNDHAYKAVFDIGKHFLKAGAVEARTRITIVFIDFILGNIMVLRVLFEDFDLMGNGVAVALVIIVAGEADIECRPFPCFRIVVWIVDKRLSFHDRPPFRQSPQSAIYDTIIMPIINESCKFSINPLYFLVFSCRID